MKFAEMTQEVQIARPTPMKVHNDIGLTPGRRKANQIFKLAVNNMEDRGRPEARDLEIDLGLVYKLKNFPEIDINVDNLDEMVHELMACLEDRIRARQRLLTDFEARRELKIEVFKKQQHLLNLNFLQQSWVCVS